VLLKQTAGTDRSAGASKKVKQVKRDPDEEDEEEEEEEDEKPEVDEEGGKWASVTDQIYS